MAFTNYTPPLLNREQSGALPDMIGNLLSGYGGAVSAKYMPREKEAEIFHKQISPLAMLASSPYFSSLHPTQQQQIANYISSIMGNQGMGGQPGQQGQSGNMGMPMGQQQVGMPMGIPQGAPQQQGGYDIEGNSLAPQNPAEHFTSKMTQSAFTSGTPHRGAGGETIYTPTGPNVQKGLEVLTETKGLKNLFDKYSQVASKVGSGGQFKRDLSAIAGGIQKTGLPFTQKISEVLGGSTLSNEAADAETFKAQMAPALRAIGFSDPEIQNMLRYYPGETQKNIEKRLKDTWPVIERKIKQHKKNLNKGVNVSGNNSNQEQPNEVQKNTNAGDMLLIGPDGSQGFVPAEKAMELLKSGQFKEAG